MKNEIKSFLKDFLFKYLQRSCVTIEKPIFIWGTGRSGTHLLYDILSLHDDLCFYKTHSRWKKGLWGDMHYGDTTPENLKSLPIPVEGMLYMWGPAGLVSKFYGKAMPNINTGVVLNNYKKLAGAWKWCSPGKKQRVLDKTPAYIMMVETINRIFPDSYHIFCIRDPRSVVNSILRIIRFTAKETSGKEYADGFFAHMYPEGYQQYVNKPLVETLCWQIEQLIYLGFSYRDLLGDRFIPFRYETLLKDAHAAIINLNTMVDLPLFEKISRLIPDSFPDYSPRFPKQGKHFEATKEICFSSEELRYFHNIQELSVKLGYDNEKAGQIAGPVLL